MPFNIGDKVKFNQRFVSGIPEGENNLFTIKCIQRLYNGEYRYYLHDNGDGKYIGTRCPCGKHNYCTADSEIELVESAESIESTGSNKNMELKTYIKKIKVGDKLLINYSGRNVEGVVGRIDYERERFDFCSNDENFDGGGGEIIAGYRNSYIFSFENRDIASVSIIEEKKHKQTRKAYVELKKEAGKIYISFKIPEEIENFFKSVSEEKVKKSSAWFKGEEGVDYYAQPEELETKLTSIDSYVFSDFGSGLIRDGKINVAILRCVGSSKGVKINSDGFSAVSNAELQDYVKRIGMYIKKLWESNISSTTIKSTITFEL